MDKNLLIHQNEEDKLVKIITALNAPQRRMIINKIAAHPMTVKEIAFSLNLSVPTISAHVKELENADLIRTTLQAGRHGSMKLCSLKHETLTIELMPSYREGNKEYFIYELPVGAYFDVDVQPTCGMANENEYIGRDDDSTTFLLPERNSAQLLWFGSGYVEYRFPISSEYSADKINCIQFSLECCSEAPGYRNEYLSDVTFWVNDKEVCTWTCPGDFGGKKGALTPDWWVTTSTQFGLLKKIMINKNGAYLDDKYVCNVTLEDLKFEKQKYISFKIGNKPDAKNMGGINLFGKKFGNYQQGIIMEIEYIR